MRSPSLLLIQRMKTGLGRLNPSASCPSSPMDWRPFLLVLLACFLRSLLIVSCYTWWYRISSCPKCQMCFRLPRTIDQ